MAPRHARVTAAASYQGNVAPQIVLDGFFKFSAPETAMLLALAGRTELVVTLPAAPQALLDAGFEEQRCGRPRRASSQTAFRAANMEREVEEIARRILAHAAAGRAFREMGIVLRVREPYGPLLETTLARCGIPARFYFSDPLGAHPAVAYLAAMVRAHLADWDHAQLLSALRMPASGLGSTASGDDFDFALRKMLVCESRYCEWHTNALGSIRNQIRCRRDSSRVPKLIATILNACVLILATMH